MAPEMDPAMAQGAPVEQGTPMEQGAPQEDPLMMIAQGAAQALQTQDCEMAMQVCDAFLQLLQSSQPAQQAEPMFKRGGKIVGTVAKKACGSRAKGRK